MQTIDPIKQAPPNPRQAGPPRVDGFLTQRPAQSPMLSNPLPPQTGARFTKLKTKKSKKRRMPKDVVLAILLSPLIAVLSVFSLVGMTIVTIYGIVSLIFRYGSRASFIVTLVAFICMGVFQIAGQLAWAQTAAVLAYILLAFGAVSLAFESKRDGRLWFKKQ